MQNAAIVAALMLADLRFLLDNDDPSVAIRMQQLVCSREADDSAPDDDCRRCGGRFR